MKNLICFTNICSVLIIRIILISPFLGLCLAENESYIDESDNFIFTDQDELSFKPSVQENVENILEEQVIEEIPVPEKLIEVPVAEVFLTKGNTEDTIPLSSETTKDIVISEDMVRNGSEFNHVVLLCNASYPVEWIYEGVGAPRLYTTQIRTFGNFFNTGTYGHSTIVVLVQERSDEQQTGSYICRGVDKQTQDFRTGFHLYFKGEFGFPSLQNVVVQPRENETTAVLPCPTTDPTATVGLYKVAPPSESRNLTLHESYAYDPRRGFILKLTDLRTPFGTYVCKFKDIESFWRIDLVPPKSKEVFIFPTSNLVQMDNLAEHNFICKAKEPIQITLPNTVDFGTIVYNFNASEEFPYSAMLTITPNVPLYSVANYFKVNCLTRKTRRILHSWEYSNFGSDELKVTYDKEQKRLLCCSKSGLTPIHELAKCETVTDCNIKKNCFNSGRCDYGFPPKFVDAPRGCTALEFMDDFPSHVMRCSIGQYSRSMLVTSNIDNDDLIIYDGTVPETENILKITTMRQKNQNEVAIRCVASIFYFSTNLMFAFEMEDGTLKFADESLIENMNSYGPTLHATVEHGTKRIFCFAPVARSSEWRNVSLTVVMLEEESTTESPIDMEHYVEDRMFDRVITSVSASTSVRTSLRKKRGYLVKVIQDI